MNSEYFGILLQYVDNLRIEEIFNAWSEPHRVFHTQEHLSSILDFFSESVGFIKHTDGDWEALILAAYFHDIAYIPGDPENEIKSVERMMLMVKNPNDPVVQKAKSIILSTNKIGKKVGIYDIFQQADCDGLINWNFEKLLVTENQIFKEFQRFSWEKYRSGRVEFLIRAKDLFPENEETLTSLIEYVKNRKPRIGVYAGSFNPFTIGHLNVLEQAENVFDKVVIAFGQNPSKETRIIQIPYTIENREIVKYDGFVSTLLKKYEESGCEVTLVRGLRNEYDLNYEQTVIQYIKDQMPNLKVVLFLCDRKFEHISSGAVRELEKVEKGSGEMYIVN